MGLECGGVVLKYLKLFCDEHHCDTEFLIKIKDDNIHEYYICPECGSMVWIYEEDEKCFVDLKEFYIRYPDRFIEDYLNLKLLSYQKIILRTMFYKKQKHNNKYYYGIVDDYGHPVEKDNGIKIINIDIAKNRKRKG